MSAVLGKTSLMKRDANLRERHSPVLFFHHPEIDQSLFGENTIGGHMNILPTIFELIAPKDFTYYSLMTSLMDPSTCRVALPLAAKGCLRDLQQRLLSA